MEKSQLDWGDLLYLYTLAKSDNLLDAAEKLEVNRTTVSRRIESLEQAIGAKLFVKKGRDLVLTEAGQMALESAERIYDEVGAMKGAIRSRDKRLDGLVIITATPKMCALLEPEISRFLLNHPGLRIEFSASMLPENLEKLESDIALRMTIEPPETLIGRRLAEPAIALYASEEFANNMTESGELRYVKGVGPIEIEPLLMEEKGLVPNIVMTCNSIELVVQALRSGVGASYLPCYVAAMEPGLVRIGKVRRTGMLDLWLLYSTQHREAPKIKAVVDVIASVVNGLVPLIEGHQS